VSQQTFGSSEDGAVVRSYDPLPSSGPWDEKDLIGNPPLPGFVEVVGPAGSLATTLDICGKWEC
jgi:hypothetical protein